MKFYLFILAFCLTSTITYAQFSISTSTNKIETKKIDSIKVSVTPQLNMAVYNNAYDKYLKKIQFKRRNRIIIKNTGLTMTQTAFDNWSAGGTNSFTARAAAYVEHNYNHEHFDVKTVFDGAFGMTHSEEELKKNEDWFNISVTPSYLIDGHWQVTGSLIIKSQFSNSYNYSSENKELVSGFFSPGQIYVSAGITYSSKKKDKFSLFLAPLSGNLLMVISDELAEQKKFGMDEVGRKFKPSFGSFIRVLYNANLYKDMITYNTKLETFWDYNVAPTIWWENKLNFKFTNLLSANLYCQIKYDENVITDRSKEGMNSFWHRLQFNESFGIGLVFNFKSKSPVTDDVSMYVKARETKRK